MSFDQVFQSLRACELSDDEVEAVLRRVRKPRRRKSRPFTLALAATALVLVVAAGVPAGRASMQDLIGSFFAGGDAPGTPVGSAEVPTWLQHVGSSPHLLAHSGRERLFAYHSGSGDVCFAFSATAVGNGYCVPAAGQPGGGADALFHGQPVALWGPTHQDDAGRWVLWGIATDDVARVELRYTDGTSTAARVTNGGFIVRAEPLRTPESLAAFDQKGNELDSVDVRQRFALAPVAG